MIAFTGFVGFEDDFKHGSFPAHNVWNGSFCAVCDVGYGEYLAAECVTCHRADGAETTIPDIVGWEAAVFEIVFKAYKTGERDHKAMVSIAAGYDDEQIAALAAYFASIQPPEQ